jgi:hypothetical protein
VHSECHTVTEATNSRVDRVRQLLENSLQNWRAHGSATELRRHLLRLLIELDYEAE